MCTAYPGLTSEFEKNIFIVWVVHGAVDNGGLTDLCVNSSGNYCKYMPNAFSSIGATEAAKIFENFITWFRPFKPSRWRWLREIQYNFLIEKRASEFQELDRAWDSSKLKIDYHLDTYFNANGKKH